MIIFSDINNPNNDAFYLNFRKDYSIDDLEYLKKAINVISSNSLNLRIKYDRNGDFKQYYFEDTISEDNIGENIISEDKFDYLEYFGEDIDGFIDELLTNPFESIFDSPLYNWKIVKYNDSVILVGVVQHVLLDGTSLFSLLPQEIEKAMNAFKNNEDYVVSNDLSYEVYVNREKEFLESEDFKLEKEYWLNQLDDYKKDWYDFENLEMNSYNLVLDSDLTNKLKNLNNINGNNISPFVLALSTVYLYFSKSSDSNDMVWNTSVNGRYYGDDLLNKMGMFVNVLPLRFNLEEDLSFKDLLLAVKTVLKSGLSHGKIQFNNYSSDLRVKGLEPGLISMYSIVSNSSDFGVEGLSYSDETEFPLHIRVNKNLSDKNGLQTLDIEYNKNCFSYKQINEIANGIKSLLNQISDDSDKLCSNYEINTNEFYKAEKYFNNLINSFDSPTIISPDVTDKSNPSDFKLLNNVFSKHISKDLILSTILFNLTKFSFSKNILISALFNRNINGNEYLNEFNELPIGYNFDTDYSIKNYLDDIKEELEKIKSFAFYPLVNNRTIDFESEILFNYDNTKVDLSNYKLIFSIVESDDRTTLNIEYDSSYFSSNIISAFLDGINVLVTKFIESPEESLKDISICEKIDNDEGFEIELANEGVIKDIFERWVKDEPDKTILYADDGEFTYKELNEKSNRIANSLIKKGVQIEDKIMFMMKRDSNLIASVLGIIKAGCAFIPIDPKYPQERINQVLEDSDSKFVIVSDGIEYSGENAINVNELLSEEDTSNPNVKLSPENLAFLIYTSGSTGKPKGVMLTHMGISNYIANHPQNMPIYSLVNNCSKMISISTVSFIVFLREIFGTIMNGMPVVFANDEESINPLELVKLFDKTGADAFGSTPTRLLEYLKLEEIQDKVAKCKFLIVGGEGFPPRLYDVIREYSDCEIYNSYGPTEVTIASHGKLIDSPIVTAGFPMLNVVDKVMDIDGNELPPYVTGELYVGGAGIARGYCNNEELTNKVFMNLNGINYYNTGDLAKKDEFDEVYVLGRNDSQIKLRGLRIELSEIEDTIANYPGINSIKVMVKEVNGIEHLCAYYTVLENVDSGELKTYLTKQIPDYMVPSYYMELDKFPTTPNGKTDFKNLPDIEIKEEKFVNPETKTEKVLFDIVKNILNIDKFGINTDLFAVGLTSLSVIKLISAISDDFDVLLSINKILKIKTIKNIALEIDSNSINLNMEDTSVSDGKLYSLTSNQLGVYFDCVKDPEKLSYNLPKFINFGDIDAERLRLSIIKSIEYHPYLKTRIVMDNGSVYQEQRDNLVIGDLIEVVEIDSTISECIDDDYIKEFIKPFNLSEGPLFRFKIIKNSKEVVLLSDFHHIIVDGTSLNLLFHQLALIYDSSNLELDDTALEELGISEIKKLEPINGFEYSLKEVKTEESNLYKEAELFYYNKIKEYDEATLVSPDLNGLEEDGVAAEVLKFISKDKIDSFCSSLAISPNNLFLAISSFVLSKFVYNRDLLFATITNGRFTPDEQNTLAMMVKTLPIALKLNSDLSFKDYFEYINKEWLDTLSYSCYPLTKIVDKYGMVPEFLYAFHGKIIEDIHMDGRIIERESLDYDGLKFKLTLNVIEIDGEYKLACQYNNALYSKELINTFLNSISIVLDKLMNLTKDLSSNDDLTSKIENTFLKDVSIVSDEMIKEFNLKEIPEYRLNKLFENVVCEHGDDIALICEDGEFTYDELNIKANRIANALIKKGVGVEDKVMFVLKRNSNVFASMFGISKAGAAFIPIDPDYPKDRIEHVLTDSSSKFIIVDEIIDINDVDLSEYSENLLNIDDLLKEEDISNPNPDLTPNNLAYLIYTSGSTGLPKGVMIEHRNITNFVYPDPSSIYCYEIATNSKKEGYKCLSIATVAFDMLMQETFIPLLNGGTVVFANDKQYKDPLALYDLIKSTGANVYNGTPSRLLQYFEMDGLKDEFTKFKIFCVGGEGIPHQLYDKVKEECSDAKFYNIYGPTETTVVCNTRLIEDGVLAIGKPLFNVHEEVMDFDSNPLPPHVVGELYIAGGGVSRAYLNRPEKNAEVYSEINGIKFYHAGDFAKWDDNGEIFILGRLDNQIKLRGLRIEIGEIESAISEYPGIKSLAVVVKKIKDNDHLCAYFTIDEEHKKDNLGENEFSIDINDLKETIGERLTHYMVPTVYMELDKMPETLNGKTDLKNLPEPVLISEYVPPENDIEAFFANTFAEILSLEQVGVTDNFFEMGGTSLLVTKITMAALNKDYNLNYGDVFDNPTPRKLAEFIISDENSGVELSEESNYDYSEINKLLEKNTLENLIAGEKEDSLGDVLLTGATGFLGIHVLHELLEVETGNIYCLVRSRKGLSSEDRLKSLLFYYFSNDYCDLFNERLHIIEGDITDYKDFEKLISYNIDTLINCAANVKHFSSGTDIEDINLGGVINGLKFAKLKDCKYVQVSTYSVAGESVDNFPPVDYKYNERDLYIGQTIDNQYIGSKFLAERAILEAAVEDDLDVKIMRVGNLMARDSDSEFQINFDSNGFINRLKAFVTIGVMPYAMLSNAVEFSPIDVTAKSIVALSKTPKECIVFHPYQHHTICFGDIIDIIKPLGLEINPVENDEYEIALDEVLNDKTRQSGVSGLITSVGSGKLKKIWLPADNAYTVQALYRLGVKWPVISEDYIYRFVEYLDDLSFFDI